MIAWEGWTLQRVSHIASDIPDGTPDCAEKVASNGYSFKKDRTSLMMCWDRLATMKVVLMRWASEEERVQDRGGGKVNA